MHRKGPCSPAQSEGLDRAGAAFWARLGSAARGGRAGRDYAELAALGALTLGQWDQAQGDPRKLGSLARLTQLLAHWAHTCWAGRSHGAKPKAGGEVRSSNRSLSLHGPASSRGCTSLRPRSNISGPSLCQASSPPRAP
ncbi:hypothetical protein KIL84_015341 [Mauremys mutica]|uniref:Uncharacterized protein n=1 Tax=Mauremys mutica TaxID=74926 RepID=A0A9D4APV9_9SAUR|nr:hypothetical protein KIL84_015341 [Mauremys mutica]